MYRALAHNALTGYVNVVGLSPNELLLLLNQQVTSFVLTPSEHTNPNAPTVILAADSMHQFTQKLQARSLVVKEFIPCP